MERLTLINGNGKRYKQGLPKLIYIGALNDVAIEHIRENTGLKFKQMPFGNYSVKPAHSDQIVKLFLTYNFKTKYCDNSTHKNTLFLKSDHHAGFDVDSICVECCKANHIYTTGLKKGDRLSC